MQQSIVRFAVLASLLVGGAASCSLHAQTVPAGDVQIQSEITKALNNKRYREVTTSVRDGIVTLAGTVGLFSEKQEAGKKAQHAHGVATVQNNIQVAGAEVSDQALGQKLANKLAYDRVGYGTTTYNFINLSVNQGVVTLNGIVYGPVDKDSADSLVANFAGVKDVIDHIQVAPVSPNDDRIRRDMSQAIYGYPTFTKYAINPAKPIRIIVVRGDVTLAGVVDSQSDKDMAYLRASAVPGAFKVINNLQVAGKDPSER